jgi:hypothetical protein
MAPEQIQGEVRAASDQYALGIMVYEWLTGRYPFSGTQFEVIMQQLYVPPPLMMIDLPEELEGLVRRTLMKDPSERFPRAMDFALAFERAAGPLPTSRSITRPVETVRVTQEVSPASSQHSQEESLPIPEVEDDPLLSSSSVQLRRVQLAFLATKPMPAMPSSSLSQANEASHPPLPEKAPKRQARRNVLLGVAGILSAGALGAGLTALFVHLGPPSSPLSPPQTQSPLISASSPSPSTGSSSAKVTPSSTSSPVGGTGPGTTPTDQPVPGSSATPDASGSPTPTSAASLNIQVVQYPATLVNGQTATITVMANEPGVQVTLSVSYNIPPPHTVTVSQTTDSQGLADLSWVVSISQGRKNVSPLATLQVSAGDAQGQTASASLSLPVSR